MRTVRTARRQLGEGREASCTTDSFANLEESFNDIALDIVGPCPAAVEVTATSQ